MYTLLPWKTRKYLFKPQNKKYTEKNFSSGKKNRFIRSESNDSFNILPYLKIERKIIKYKTIEKNIPCFLNKKVLF